jgi:hypothetical protein
MSILTSLSKRLKKELIRGYKMLRREFIQTAASSVLVPYFSFSSGSEKSPAFPELIKGRNYQYISMGSGFYGSRPKGVVGTSFYDVPLWTNNALALYDEENACFLHLGKLSLVDTCLLDEGRAIHVRSRNSLIKDSDVDYHLDRIGIRDVERRVIDVSRTLHVAFDLEKRRVHVFPGEGIFGQ